MKKFAVLETVNSNAHNTRYGRDCHAAPVVAGFIYADSWQEAEARAHEEGFGYQPAEGRTQYLLHSVRRVPLFQF